MHRPGALIASFLLLAMVNVAQAGEAAVREFQRALYEADHTTGIAKLEVLRRQDPADTEAVFGVGFLQFVLALANFQSGLFDHSGAKPPGHQGQDWLTMAVPMHMRQRGWLFVPHNPNAKPMTYETLRRLQTELVGDLAEAEATLARVGDRAVKLPFQPFRVALDANRDGQLDERERSFLALLGVPGGTRSNAFREAELAFDTADASWMRGYSHLLMASINALLAFDYRISYEAYAHSAFGLGATKLGRDLQSQASLARPRSAIETDLAALEAKLGAIGNAADISRQGFALRRALRELPRTSENDAERQRLQGELDALLLKQREINRLYRDRQFLQQELADRTNTTGRGYGQILDAVALIHTFSWPVADRNRLMAVRQHLLRVMQLNRNTWRLVRLETDDDREWLPSAAQTTPFGGRKLTDQIIDSWLATTALAEQVLNGEKLLPHPRFLKGINMLKFFEKADRLDLVMLMTGHDLLPFLDTGEIVDRDTWRTITDPMGSQFANYAFWFN